MKFALIFLMSAVVVVTNQQYLRNYPAARSRAWWLPKPPAILNRYQQHYYEQPTIEADVPYFRYAKPMIKNHRPVLVYAQPEDEELLSPTELMDPNAAGPYGDVIADDNQQIFVGPQSRSKASLQSLLPEKLFPRYFFGTEATIKNPFIKTATYTLSSTVTLSSVHNCIHSTKFLDDAARRRYCARRRRLLDLLEKKTANEERQFPIIAPSEPLQSETTALPFSADLMRDNRQIHQQTSPSWNINNPTSSAILSSSKEEDTDADENQSRVLNLPNFSNLNNNNNNQQRFVYIASPYVASTTLTSYSFVSTTVTRTVDVAIEKGLNCIPVGYYVCE